MNENNQNGSFYNYTQATPTEPKENVLAGILGAFLFSLAGGILWYVLYQIGIVAAVSGLVGSFAAIYGYIIFSKGQSIKGIIISVIIALLVLVFAWYMCLVTDVYNVYKEMGYTTDYQLTFADAFQTAPEFLTMPEIGVEYWKTLVMGIVFAIIGGIKPVVSALR